MFDLYIKKTNELLNSFFLMILMKYFSFDKLINMILSKYFAQYNNETDLKFYNLVEDKKKCFEIA